MQSSCNRVVGLERGAFHAESLYGLPLARSVDECWWYSFHYYLKLVLLIVGVFGVIVGQFQNFPGARVVPGCIKQLQLYQRCKYRLNRTSAQRTRVPCAAQRRRYVPPDNPAKKKRNKQRETTICIVNFFSRTPGTRVPRTEYNCTG